MKKSIKQILSFIMAFIMLVPFSNSVMAKESNTEDKNGNSVVDMQNWNKDIKIGDEIYFTINLEPYEGIYKINKKATKTKTVLKKPGSITHMSHYGKWIYFIWDKGGGGNGCIIADFDSEMWLCKVKTDGTGFKTICRSNSCMIRNDILYYQKIKHDYDEDSERKGFKIDIDTGKIGKLNLKTGKKSTFKGKNMHLKAVEKNKIYYYIDKKNESILYSMDAKGEHRKKLKKEKSIWDKIIYNNSLYWISGNKLYKKSFKTKKTKKICAIKNLFSGNIDIKKDKIYVLAGNYSKQKLYCVSIKSGKKKCIMKSRGYGHKIYGNLVIGRRYMGKDYKDKNNNLYNTELYSYNLKTKKKVQLLRWYEQ